MQVRLEYQVNWLSLRVLDAAVKRIVHQNIMPFSDEKLKTFLVRLFPLDYTYECMPQR